MSCLWLALTAVLFAARNLGFRIKRTVSLVFAVLFPVSAWFAFERMTATGLVFMLSVFAVIWLADICAYFCGRLFGKRKMAPAISPGKTWAGAVGAVVFVFAFAIIAAETLPHDMIFTSVVLDKMGYVAGFAAVLLLVAVSIAGDLFESAVKRRRASRIRVIYSPGTAAFLTALIPRWPFFRRQRHFLRFLHSECKTRKLRERPAFGRFFLPQNGSGLKNDRKRNQSKPRPEAEVEFPGFVKKNHRNENGVDGLQVVGEVKCKGRDVL